MRTKNFPSNVNIRIERGVAAVELAFVIVVLLLIVAGTIGFGRTFWYADALTKATRDGARLLTTWPAATISSAGVGTAQTLTKNAANAANISVPLTVDNIQVQCDYSSPPTFDFVDCVDATTPATTPANIKVSITGVSISIGEWFPFISTSGVINYGNFNLSPHTTMRYMN
jgi:Flp pilus assembly protein TadG